MLMMMLMMKKRKGLRSLAVVSLFLASVHCILPPSNDDLNEISRQGGKYLDKQIENGINGVQEMKSVMEKFTEEHQKYLDALKQTKQEKEEALHKAQELEVKLEQEEEVCNDTIKAMWEECKPCLKTTCIKYYSRTCTSGSGLVGRQLEDILNRTNPFSIWINGQKMDVLEQEDQRQTQEFKNLEDKYTVMADNVDSIFSDSMKVADHFHYTPPLFSLPSFFGPFRHRRSIRSLFQDSFQGFQSLFAPMMGMNRNFFGSLDMIDTDVSPDEDTNLNEDVVITKPFGNGQMTCREIRRNSASCIRFRGECEKCKEMQHIDCSGKKPLEGPLKEELEGALALTERLTQRYNSLLRRVEEQVSKMASVLDQLNQQSGWVSSLANNTDSGDDRFRVLTVDTKDNDKKPDEDKAGKPGQTDVSVKLFDSPTMHIGVPGDIPWTDPKFSEVVAQGALDRYKQTAVIVK